MTTTVAVLNEKGGVGKSTTALAFAHALADRFPVTLIDLDPLCAATLTLGLTGREPHNIGTVLAGGALLDAATPVTYDGRPLVIVPGSLELEDVVTDLIAADAGVMVLRRAIEPAFGLGVVIIDCPAGLNVLSLNALVAADHVLIPTTPDPWSIIGAVKVLEVLNGYTDSNGEEVPGVNDLRRAFDYAPVESVATIATMVEHVTAHREGVASLKANPALCYMGEVPARRGRNARRQLREVYEHLAALYSAGFVTW